MEADGDVRAVEESDPAHLRRAGDRALPPGGPEHSLPLPLIHESDEMHDAGDVGLAPGVAGHASRSRVTGGRRRSTAVRDEPGPPTAVVTAPRPRRAPAAAAAAGLSAGLPILL